MFQYQNVAANAPKTKHYSRENWATPAVMFSEGMHPAGQFMPAPYLPLIRVPSKDIKTHVVISTGKVVAFDSNGYIVPAGILESDATYTEVDVQEGLIGPDGQPVAAGDKVKDKLNAAGLTVSAPVGVALYDFWRHPGGDGINPAHFNYKNLNYQHRVQFVCDYMVELPLVESDAEYEKAPLKGISAFIAAKGANAGTGTLADFTSVKPGDFVTFDKNSNMIVAQASVAKEKVLGQVLQVVKPQEDSLLKLVRTSSAGGHDLDKMPGTATKGAEHKVAYSNGYGLVRVNLINR